MLVKRKAKAFSTPTVPRLRLAASPSYSIGLKCSMIRKRSLEFNCSPMFPANVVLGELSSIFISALFHFVLFRSIALYIISLCWIPFYSISLFPAWDSVAKRVPMEAGNHHFACYTQANRGSIEIHEFLETSSEFLQIFLKILDSYIDSI